MHNEIIRALGRIEGKVDGIEKTQTKHGEKMDTIDKRVRDVEVNSAKNGVLSGGIAGVGVTLLATSIKTAMGG